MQVNWFEFKYLDKSTNHSTQTEVIKYFKKQGVAIKYHCSFKKDKKFFSYILILLNPTLSKPDSNTPGNLLRLLLAPM